MSAPSRIHIRRARRLVIGEMDCDELINELMSVADPQGAGAGLAEGAPPAAAPAATPEEDERVQKHRERPAAIAAGGQAVGKHSPPIKSTLWTIAKSRSFTPATKQGLGRR